ncbi:LysM peptidoglycan-binding domain-containing protein [Listeria ilorinensis]|uniref:LysM peptidoglycan-binding domain-containing protein n=1 Tax=Listeria ilorinensis TaxID=2867439 RepID=UPI001EF56E25|nr:LysM peptidoglycan-binding domain-containing protein [Listeria ilorinensis]
MSIVNMNESEVTAAEATQYPVEQGTPISDHVQVQNKTLSITGFLLGSSAEQDYLKIHDFVQKGTVVTWRGRVYFHDVLVNSIIKDYDTIENGMAVTISITTLRRASSPWVQKKTSSGKKQTTSKSQAGTWITVKKGDCYWKWWKQYGTSIAQLRSWNKWPDRKIPIGARARVK